MGSRRGGRCSLRCRLDDRITAALNGPDGSIAEQLRPVREAVLAVDNPRSGHVWMRSPAVAVLTEIAQGRLALSHEAFDELRQTASIIHLRDLLVSLGLLPHRDPGIAKIEGVISRRAAKLTDEHSKLLRSFGRWSVLRRARRKVDLGRLTAHAAKGAASEVHEAARFMLTLEQQGRSLPDIQQKDVDA